MSEMFAKTWSSTSAVSDYNIKIGVPVSKSENVYFSRDRIPTTLNLVSSLPNLTLKKSCDDNSNTVKSLDGLKSSCNTTVNETQMLCSSNTSIEPISLDNRPECSSSDVSLRRVGASTNFDSARIDTESVSASISLDSAIPRSQELLQTDHVHGKSKDISGHQSADNVCYYALNKFPKAILKPVKSWPVIRHDNKSHGTSILKQRIIRKFTLPLLTILYG